MLDNQINLVIKKTEEQLASVHKERAQAITIIEDIVKSTYQGHHGSAYITIKLYGSMASQLAIQQSDVDLAVVGLDFNGNKDLLISHMQQLCD